MMSLDIGQNEIYTLTTLSGGHKGRHETPPPSAPFPVPYTDDFEGITPNYRLCQKNPCVDEMLH